LITLIWIILLPDAILEANAINFSLFCPNYSKAILTWWNTGIIGSFTPVVINTWAVIPPTYLTYGWLVILMAFSISNCPSWTTVKAPADDISLLSSSG
jgi:hypothetical protein